MPPAQPLRHVERKAAAAASSAAASVGMEGAVMEGTVVVATGVVAMVAADDAEEHLWKTTEPFGSLHRD